MTARYLCAICVDRPAETLTAWERDDGTVRTIVACRPCLAPVPDPIVPHDLAECVSTRPALAKRGCKDPTLRDAIMATVRQRGEATTKELQDALEMTSDADRGVLTKSLSRLVARGQLTEAWVDESDHGHGRRFSLVETPPTPCSGVREAVIATVRRLGAATRGQVIAELAATAPAELVRKHLRRLEECGAIDCSAGMYRVTGATATTRAVAESLSAFEALPEEFDTLAIDPDRKRAAVIVRAWLQEGLVSCVRAKRDSTVGGQRVWFPAVWRKSNAVSRAA